MMRVMRCSSGLAPVMRMPEPVAAAKPTSDPTSM